MQMNVMRILIADDEPCVRRDPAAQAAGSKVDNSGLTEVDAT